MNRAAAVRLGIGLMVFVLQAFAQDDTVKTVEKITSSEAVLTREDFQRLSCENVGDALRHVTGVFVRNGQIGMRDVAPDKVVILLDGQRLNTAQGGGVDVVTLPIDNVERIEVIRGGNSALYGADAVGGVIKITTRKATGNTVGAMNVNVHGTFGSFNERIGSLSVSQPVDKLFYLLSYKRTMTDGNFEYTTLSKTRAIWVNNDQSSHDVFGKVSYGFEGGGTASLSGSYFQSENGAPGLIGQETPRARIGYLNKYVNTSYDQPAIFGDFNLKAQWYMLLFQLKYDSPDSFVPIHSTHNNDAYSFEMQQAGKLAEHIDLAYGYTYRLDKLQSTDIGSKQRNNHAAYGSMTYTISNLGFLFDEYSVTPAVRYDAPSDFSKEFSPKVSFSLKYTQRWKGEVRGHVTRSYRAPTFNDLYWPRDSYAEGNPNLKPEIGINYDLGGSLTIPGGGAMLSINYFVNNLENLILWAPGASGLWRPENISKSEATGSEIAVRIKPYEELAELGFDYTYLTALDKSDSPTTHDKDLIYRPRNKADMSLTLRLEGIELTMIYHYVGKRYTTAANTVWMDPYKVMSVTIGYGFKALGASFTAKVEGSNLTDLDYMVTEGSPVPGRAFRFSLSTSF